MSGNVSATRELASFLRTRRERLAPGDLNLPEYRRPRRTPGLRREEVAELAGVSVDYVVRLEQGRGLRPSPDVLDALARALRLTEDERIYVFDLAEHRPVRRKPEAIKAGPLARLVQDLSPLPAMVFNHRFDILAWNPEACGLLMVDLDELPERQRNTIRLCLLHPAHRNFYRDREQIIREGIADLRTAWAAHSDDALLAELIDELTRHSDEFAELWDRQDVRVNGRGQKRLQHRDLGSFAVDYEILTPRQDPAQRLVIYRAADAAAQSALDTIAETARR